MASHPVTCAFCGSRALKTGSEIGRAKRTGLALYCDRICSGKARRKHLTAKEKKDRKAAYDAEYRVKNLARIRSEKAKYYRENHDREKEREYRKRTAHLHAEYCRRPEYREWKKAYDRQFRCKREYGPFWEAASILFDVENTVRSQASDYEIRVQNGTLNKKQNRRRDDARQVER